MNALQPAVAKSFLRQLSGFRGYPKDDEAQGRFIEVLCEVSLSVEHALAIIWAFDENFPTIREIRDTAYNLRSKFEPKVDQKAEWEAKYGKPDPGWSERFQARAAAAVPSPGIDPEARKRQFSAESRAVLWQAIRDSLYYDEGPGSGRPDSFWHEAAQKHKRNHPAEVAAFRLQLQQSGWDVLMAVDWLKSMPVVPSRQSAPVAVLERPITQADVKAELQRAGREAGDGE